MPPATLPPESCSRSPSGTPSAPSPAATRELFGNPNPFVGDGFPEQYPILVTIGWMLVLLAIFTPLAIRKYRNASR